MAKNKTRFICQHCGAISANWLGKCPECNEWDTYVEEKEEKTRGVTVQKKDPIALRDVVYDQSHRMTSGLKELDLVLGGGIVEGSLILVGGDPGIGKSTMLLQVANYVAKSKKVLYVSGEESLSQIKLRAERITKELSDMLLLAENEIGLVLSAVEKEKPALLIVDSIQTMYDESISSAPGSVSQVREITNRLMLLAKRNNIVVFIIGHVTKSGAIAGPKVLEHMVDTVLYFEGDKNSVYKMLRAVKNRFGSTNEMGVFEMQQQGLVGIDNPSKLFIDNKPKGANGSLITASVEGTRPILLEVQALTSVTNYASPRRLALGVDYNKLTILIAVLEKVIGMPLSDVDVYVNLVGGVTVQEPALDLAIAMAISSSHKNMPIDDGTIIFGEIGLTGEIRGVSDPIKRVNEAQKLGFKRVILPKSNITKQIKVDNLVVIGVNTLQEAFDTVF
ncbi:MULTISPECIES: DNA repair protein RadA [unclassified Fusibacter]|uniref:DNA repair protein RadA n=1 Tax=unclassified Fusibacter TaxID=2624464 RepID=UPI00101201EC|nr:MULTISPECIES: DNA repair protein RadA [unclassified Fusibacter]MCK8061355.1 DNA repair protein RadA [Fusibacter sp. A2]NPE23602.1 DNA repair protein RadA [Fusibacter sp. A1]RXV59010.1 DNA repair protein RadA [Fusibacter sp. A1]